MKARINHVTIVSEDNYALGRFYEGFFHLKPTGTKGALDDVSIGDGHVGMNIKARQSGQPAQLDHFGIEVDDLSEALARLRTSYPKLEWLERPGSKAISAHDPDGNVFGLWQTGTTDADEIYSADGRTQDRVIDHFALRVLHPEKVAAFYETVFDLKRIDGPGPSKNAYLTDGHVTLVIIPWRLEDFEGTGISARGMDHIGFKVESVAALKADIERATERNYRFQPSASIVGRGKEGAGRLVMFRKTCPLGCHHMADPDGLLLDVTE
jgi:predicted enzyme related to lactoylglutathione lyase